MTVSRAGATGVFISYRREDAAYPAGWLFDRLADHFGAGLVFKDVDSIRPGDNFSERINVALGSCAVLLAVIGPRWLTVTGAAGRRLDDPADFVRREIEAAITRRVLVIPVLVDGARMPPGDELPVGLRSLADRQAVELAPARFSADTGRLVKVVSAAISEAMGGPGAKRGMPDWRSGGRDGTGNPADARHGSGIVLVQPGTAYPEISRRSWHLAAFLSAMIPAYGMVPVLLLLFKRDRAIRMNVILSLEISLFSLLGLAIVVVKNYSLGGSSMTVPSEFLLLLGFFVYAVFAVILIYCAIQVCMRRQPVIFLFTRVAFRLAYGGAYRD